MHRGLFRRFFHHRGHRDHRGSQRKKVELLVSADVRRKGFIGQLPSVDLCVLCVLCGEFPARLPRSPEWSETAALQGVDAQWGYSGDFFHHRGHRDHRGSQRKKVELLVSADVRRKGFVGQLPSWTSGDLRVLCGEKPPLARHLAP